MQQFVYEKNKKYPEIELSLVQQTRSYFLIGIEK